LYAFFIPIDCASPLTIVADNNIASLNDVLTGTERVESTPLPVAYTIAIGQITWLYVFLLPFQLYSALGWVTIPASVAAAYIILGILFIGREVENPFGNDTNDLPLESFCAQIASELDVIASKRKPRSADWVESGENRPLWPLSRSSYAAWAARPEARVREAVGMKTEMNLSAPTAGTARAGTARSVTTGKASTAASSLRKKDGKVEVSKV
jgi:ion channel-forming bestrophin family protein